MRLGNAFGFRLAAVRHPAGFGLLTWLALAAAFPLIADNNDANRNDDNDRIDLVLYSGPLVHDTTWMLTRGTNTNAFRGQCSMIPADVRNTIGSASERVRFSAKPGDFGVWDMTWTDTIAGKATAATGQRYRYTYRQRMTYQGTTTDGKAPAPGRRPPTPTDDGFLRTVPSNVNAPVVAVDDWFILQDEAGGHVVAESQVLWKFRLKITPDEQPPAFFPVAVYGLYILATHDQLAGQLGCDPL